MSEFEELYTEHVDAVFRYAVSCVGRHDIAEDIASEAFLALYQNKDRIDTSQLPGWLLTVARNRATDYWRHQAVEQRYASFLVRNPAHVAPVADNRVLDNEELKPVHRACLMLRYVHGMTRTEIAERTGLSPDQVKERLRYGLRVLRDQLVPEASRGLR